MIARLLTVFVLGEPVAQGSTRAFVAGGRPVVTHTGGDRLRAWRQDVTDALVAKAEKEGWGLDYDGPVTVTVTFYLPCPATTRFKEAPWGRPDLDKLIRAVGDALSPRGGGGVIKDDSRIIRWEATKVYDHEGAPGATITVLRFND